jgi:acyl-CoA ligase (AMP-forming) (exosortase A-associated)
MFKPYLLHHLLEHAAGEAPAQEAIVDLVGTRRSLDYAEFHRMAGHCAAVLQQQGLERRDRVAIYLPKSTEESIGIFAVSMAGGAFVDVNSLLMGHQVAHILADCGVKYLITSSREWKRIREEVAGVDSLRCLLLIDVNGEEIRERFPVVRGIMRGDEKPRAVPVIGEDLAAILYTSGSTGKPRGVMLSHRNLLAGARIVSTYLEIGASERILSILPFSFDYGLNQLLTAVQHAATIVLFQYRFPAEIVRAIQAENITGLAGVPLIWAGLVHHTSGLSETRLSTLRYITNSGGAVPTATVRNLRKLLPTTRIFLMYGLTEAFRSTFLPPEEVDRRPDSIGKAIPECEILVVNSEGRPCKPGELGILVHRGPTVSLGYWGKPELTAQFFRPHPFIPADQGGETVCYSGDLVKMDEEGFLYFAARADGQIKSQGYRVSPAEVEEVLMETGELAQAAVIGLPGGDGGEKIHAVVVPVTPASFDAEEILRRCALRLPGYMVPKNIEVIDALPKTPNGKIDYKGLRAARMEQAQ